MDDPVAGVPHRPAYEPMFRVVGFILLGCIAGLASGHETLAEGAYRIVQAPAAVIDSREAERVRREREQKLEEERLDRAWTEEDKRNSEARASEQRERERREAEQRERERQEAERRERERQEAEQRERERQEAERRERERREVEDRERERREAELREQERNPTVTFRIQSAHPSPISLMFRSVTDRSRRWPEEGRIYRLDDRNTHDYRLRCERGEKICYGAWVRGSALNQYWGAGFNVRETCSNCCLTCPTTATTSIIMLNSSDAIRPAPSLTWHFKSEHSQQIAVSMYSLTRPGHRWPSSNQSFVLRSFATQQFKIACLAGERICYGAWPAQNPNSGYWGAGQGGARACTNCCYECNGEDTRTIVLNE